jgi:hypothetical protein
MSRSRDAGAMYLRPAGQRRGRDRLGDRSRPQLPRGVRCRGAGTQSVVGVPVAAARRDAGRVRAGERGAAVRGRPDAALREPGGEAIDETIAFGHDGTPVDARGQWFAQPGIARTIALGLYTEAMHDALVVYGEDRQKAR